MNLAVVICDMVLCLEREPKTDGPSREAQRHETGRRQKRFGPGPPLDVDKIYRRYFEDSVSLAKSRIFDGIGHPDAIKLFGHKPSYSLSGCYECLAEELSKSNMYADQNSGAARRCPETASLGMDEELLGITSSDAHCPEDVGYKIKELNSLIENS